MNQMTRRMHPGNKAGVCTANDVALLRMKLDHATVKLATVQAENRRLRKMTTNGRQGRLLHRTAADARQIVGWRFAGLSVTRRACYEYGMSERRWAWAVALLKLAKVLDHNVACVDDFEVEDLDQALAQVDAAAAACERDGLHRLIFRLPKGRAKPPKK